MNEDEATVIAAAEMAADPVPDVMIPIPDGTVGGCTFTGCWAESRAGESYGFRVGGEHQD